MFPTLDVSHVGRKWLDVPYAAASAAQKLDIYLPAEGEGLFPVLLRIHGGGFEIGDKRDANMSPFLEGIEQGYGVVSVNYRLSGEAVFPAAVQDVKAAVRWVRAHGASYHLDSSRICAWGDSAGGYLAVMVAVTEAVDLFDDPALGNAERPSGVLAAVDWFGPIDFSTMGEQRDANGLPPPGLPPGIVPDPGIVFGSQGSATGPQGSPEAKFLGGPLAEVPHLVRAANPMRYVHPGMSPILIQHGDLDPLVPVQQSVEFAGVIDERAGSDRYELDILKGAGHGGPEFESCANMERVFAFIDRHLKQQLSLGG